MKFGVRAEPENAAQADGHERRSIQQLGGPRFKPKPKKVGLVDRVMSQIVGGLAGDALVTHTITPKPKGKRARRRERGRLKAERKRISHMQYQMYKQAIS